MAPARKKSTQKTQKKSAPVNPHQIFIKLLAAWTSEMPPDMRDESPREKLLDAMLRLFEKLDAANLKPPIKNLYKNREWRTAGVWVLPLRNAIHWQFTVLEILVPPCLVAPAPDVLTLAVLRWISVWLEESTPGQSRLMATMDRDLGRLDVAVQQILRLSIR